MANNRSMSASIARRTAPIVLAIGLLAVAGCVAESPEVTIDDPVLVEGRDIYIRNCASCHGPTGDGGVGLKISGGAVIETFPMIEEQIELVGVGRNNMPAYGDRLTEEQIRLWFATPARCSSPAALVPPIPTGLDGLAPAGRRSLSQPLGTLVSVDRRTSREPVLVR